MSSGGDSETCKFGHTFVHFDSHGGGVSGEAADLVNDIKKGKISNLDELREEGGSIMKIMGQPIRKLKGKSGGQGTGYGVVLTAPDKYDDDLGYNVSRVTESIFVSPQSQLHDEFMQRKQQAEQRVNQTLSNFSDILETKHLLEHDIRKLRSRAESFNSHDEDMLKGDFVQLVDGAGAGGQGADEQALRFLRDQNIYPTIVADFMEMDSVNDLKTAKQMAEGKDDKTADDFNDGALADLPRNEKAILRKKYTMYEKWKDMYGSEVNRRLKELKAQLRNIEQSIEKTKDWLEPYVRDVVMINEMGDQQGDLTKYYEWKGYSSMERQLEFICHKGFKKENGRLVPESDDDKITHYRIMHIFGVHVVTAKGEQPNQPGGSSTGVVFWRPAVVCKHVFENFFEPKIEEAEELVEEMHSEYVGDFNVHEDNQKIKEARKEQEISIRELREMIEEELDERVAIEFSSKLRRVEDGLDTVESISEDFSEEHLEALKEVLDIDLGESSDKDSKMLKGVNKELAKFTGQTDQFYLDGSEQNTAIQDMITEFRFEFYFDYKIGFGMNTMK